MDTNFRVFIHQNSKRTSISGGVGDLTARRTINWSKLQIRSIESGFNSKPREKPLPSR